MTPTIGRIVHYKISEQDAHAINYARTHGPDPERVGNTVREGDVFPALIVRTWGDTAEAAVQLQVFLDGNDTHWATSVTAGDGPRQYAWPARV